MSSKNYAIFWGGGWEVIKRSHWITGGRGGGQDRPKKDHIIFERSLTFVMINLFLTSPDITKINFVGTFCTLSEKL